MKRMKEIRGMSLQSVTLPAVLALSVLLSGCSAVGLGVGAAIDKAQSDRKVVEGWKVGTIKPGRWATVCLSDGSQVAGIFENLADLPEAEYADTYSRMRAEQADAVALPAIGDTLVIAYRKGRAAKYEFRGFGYRYTRSAGIVSLKKKKFPAARYQYLSAHSIAESKLEEFYLDDLQQTTARNGNVVEGFQIRKLANEGKIPLKSAIALRTPGGKNFISIERIRTLQVSRKKNAKWIGLALGLAVDVVCVIHMASWEGPQIFGDSGWK